MNGDEMKFTIINRKIETLISNGMLCTFINTCMHTGKHPKHRKAKISSGQALQGKTQTTLELHYTHLFLHGSSVLCQQALNFITKIFHLVSYIRKRISYSQDKILHWNADVWSDVIAFWKCFL